MFKALFNISRIEFKILEIVDTLCVLNLVNALQSFLCSACTAVVNSLWVSWWEGQGGLNHKTIIYGQIERNRVTLFPKQSESGTSTHKCVCVFLGLCLCFPKCCLLYPDQREKLTYMQVPRGEPLGRLALVARDVWAERGSPASPQELSGGWEPRVWWRCGSTCQMCVPLPWNWAQVFAWCGRKQGCSECACLFSPLVAFPQDHSEQSGTEKKFWVGI